MRASFRAIASPAGGLSVRFGTPPQSVGSGIASNPVTTALNATGSGTRYDATSDAELDLVPWATLGPGDVVNIFYKASAYTRKFGLRAQGTESNPVIINGVTDASGNRPRFDFANSTTCPLCNPGGSNNIFTGTPAFGESLGGIVVKRGVSDNFFSYQPKWIEFRNLEIFGAGGATGRQYTSLANGTQTFGADAAGFYLLLVEDCTIQNCVVTDNGFGLFTMAKEGDTNDGNAHTQTCKRITLRCNRFSGNGVSGSFYEHGTYLQSLGPNIVEGNYFGGLRSGAQGSCYKSRSSGEVFRYNWVRAASRSCDWVHSEDNQYCIAAAADYGIIHAYGNVIESDSAPYQLHLGGDNLGEDDTGALLDPIGSPPYGTSREYMYQGYFYSNTIVNNYSSFRSSVFDLSLAGTGSSPRTRVDAWNNAFLNDAAATTYWVEYVGSVYLRGKNHGWNIAGDARDGATVGRYDINTVGTLNTGTPGVTDFEAGDYTPTVAGALRNQATADPGGQPASYVARAVQYQPRFRSNGLIVRPTVNDLGALEYGAS